MVELVAANVQLFVVFKDAGQRVVCFDRFLHLFLLILLLRFLKRHLLVVLRVALGFSLVITILPSAEGEFGLVVVKFENFALFVANLLEIFNFVHRVFGVNLFLATLLCNLLKFLLKLGDYVVALFKVVI